MNSDTSTLLEPVEACDPVHKRESLGASRPEISRVREAPDWLDRGQIPALNGMRAIAVSFVLLVHSLRAPGFFTSPTLRHFISHGHIGVDIFFVISGFLITTLLVREYERHGRIDLKRFYVRRSLRIIPAYCAFLLVMAICQYAGEFRIPSRDWIAALTYTTNFLYHPSWELGHTWSLSVEEHFYLIWPVVLFSAGAVGGWRMAWGCVAVCWFLRCVISLVLPLVMAPADASYFSALAENSTFTRLDTISMGCLLALACRSDYWRGWLDSLTRPPLMALYALTIFASLELGASAKFHLCVFYTLSGFCIALLVWGLVRNDGLLRRSLDNPVLTTIGIGSYSIYLWQQLFIHPSQPGWIHAFPQNIVLVLGVAFLSYRFVEIPMNRLKDRVTA